MFDCLFGQHLGLEFQRTNTEAPGPDLWVDTRSWGRVA